MNRENHGAHTERHRSGPHRAAGAGHWGEGIMFRGEVVAALAILLVGCSTFETKEGRIVEKNADGISIKIGYDAVGADTQSTAAEHCAKYGKQAVWYGHDRNGSMHYKCR